MLRSPLNRGERVRNLRSRFPPSTSLRPGPRRRTVRRRSRSAQRGEHLGRELDVVQPVVRDRLSSCYRAFRKVGNAMTTPDISSLRFDPPGPGPWTQDPVHFPRPTTRYFQETHPPAFKRGTNDFARYYGLLIDGLQVGYVNGFA